VGLRREDSGADRDAGEPQPQQVVDVGDTGDLAGDGFVAGDVTEVLHLAAQAHHAVMDAEGDP
jgi:hypothetical protein